MSNETVSNFNNVTKIIPVSIDAGNGYNGRVLSEKNITTLIKNVTSHPNYVISADVENTNESVRLKFMLEGHYIELTSDYNKNVYVKLVYNNDSNSPFHYATEVKISNTEPPETELSDWFYVWNKTNKSVPQASLYRLSCDNISGLTDMVIDGGEI